jgi:hypothetical protein
VPAHERDKSGHRGFIMYALLAIALAVGAMALLNLIEFKRVD